MYFVEVVRRLGSYSRGKMRRRGCHILAAFVVEMPPSVWPTAQSSIPLTHLASERAYVGDGAIGSHTGHTAKWPDPDRGRDASYVATRRTVVGILDSNPRG